MANNILDRYGIKEVADVTFYKLDSNGIPMYPVLYLDTLKVSTIEQTAETSEARGGKGNAALIAWDYGKEINVTLEDALFSAKSMAIMFGNGLVKTYEGDDTYVMKTERFTATVASDVASLATNGSADWSKTYVGPDGKTYTKINPKFYAANLNYTDRNDGTNLISGTLEVGQSYFCTYDLKVSGSVIEVSADSFPGTYYVTGDTYARNENSGTDEFFQFIIPRAKVTSENTITLEAEGDPSVFNMNLKVLRPADGVMMKLVKYTLVGGADAAAESLTAKLHHNHTLDNLTQ
jgi:hypothetical protein